MQYDVTASGPILTYCCVAQPFFRQLVAQGFASSANRVRIDISPAAYTEIRRLVQNPTIYRCAIRGTLLLGAGLFAGAVGADRVRTTGDNPGERKECNESARPRKQDLTNGRKCWRGHGSRIVGANGGPNMSQLPLSDFNARIDGALDVRITRPHLNPFSTKTNVAPQRFGAPRSPGKISLRRRGIRQSVQLHCATCRSQFCTKWLQRPFGGILRRTARRQSRRGLFAKDLWTRVPKHHSKIWRRWAG
jgi:hypothetical protein